MRNVIDVLPPEQQADPEAQTRRTVMAYAALISGTAMREDVELVLVDLALYTRYYATAPLDMDAADVKALDQRRGVLNRILDAAVRGGADIDGLMQATLRAPDLPMEEIIG